LVRKGFFKFKIDFRIIHKIRRQREDHEPPPTTSTPERPHSFTGLFNQLIQQMASTAGATIYALSSAVGRAGVAVLRLSGPHSQLALQQLMSPTATLPPPRYAALRRIFHPKHKTLLDQAMVLRFTKPHSFTGEVWGWVENEPQFAVNPTSHLSIFSHTNRMW